MSQPFAWPSTLTLTAAQSPTGAALTLTWTDNIGSIGVGGAYAWSSAGGIPGIDYTFGVPNAGETRVYLLSPLATSWVDDYWNPGTPNTLVGTDWMLAAGIGDAHGSTLSIGYSLSGQTLTFDPTGLYGTGSHTTMQGGGTGAFAAFVPAATITIPLNLSVTITTPQSASAPAPPAPATIYSATIIVQQYA